MYVNICASIHSGDCGWILYLSIETSNQKQKSNNNNNKKIRLGFSLTTSCLDK